MSILCVHWKPCRLLQMPSTVEVEDVVGLQACVVLDWGVKNTRDACFFFHLAKRCLAERLALFYLAFGEVPPAVAADEQQETIVIGYYAPRGTHITETLFEPS